MNSIVTNERADLFFSIIIYLIFLLIISSASLFSQTNNNYPPSPTLHNEVKDDDYIRVTRESQDKSPAYKYSMNNITTVQVNVDENGMNIVGDAANEPSIAVDPNNRNRMAIGWRQFNTISSNFRQAGFGYTTDNGNTWIFPGVIEPGIFRSDPVLDVDADGNFYYNSLATSPEFFTDVFKSTDGGSTWGDKTFAQGGDKQWMAIDKTGGSGDGHIYSFWTANYSVCAPGHFTRSTDGGFSFEDCIIIPNNPYWGTLTIGAEGELFVGGANGSDFLVAKSLNAQIPGQQILWENAAVVSLDGAVTFGGTPNPGGLMGQANIAVDTSGGIYHGNVYLLCTVNRHSSNDPADIMFARSTDGGVSWSSPTKINDDTGTSAFQWFGTMSVAPNGRIDVVWLDTRDNPGNISALYYSNSHDGGITWSQNVRISEHFDSHAGWPNQNKIGDYFDMVSDVMGARLAWAATFNGEQDIYYSYISGEIVPVELISFSASAGTNSVTLHWSTATELNNYGFEIERCTGSVNIPAVKTDWSTVGFREGSGSTSEQKNYSFNDRLISASSYKYFYRLKQIDFDGSFDYSEILEVELVPLEFSLSQNYPNPFNPSTVITYQLPVSSDVTLKVYDVLGREVATLVNEFKEAGRYEIQFNADDYTSGFYFYKLQTGSFAESKKMILLK